MTLQQLNVWTNEITNDTLTFNAAGTNELNIIELSINLKSGVGKFYGLLPLIPLGVTYASPGYINLTVGQPVTFTSNFNFPLGTIVVDCTGGGVIQVIATQIGHI